MQRSTWIAGTAGAVTAAVLPGFASAQPAPPVRVGDAPGDAYAQGYYANEGGFFQKAGLNVDFQIFGSGGPITEAAAGGSIDIGIGTTIQIANAIAHGIPFTIIAPGCINTKESPSGFLIVGKNSALHGPKDFDGKTVALTQRRSITELALTTWLQKNGADPTKTKTIEMPFGEMGPAVERGTVDAAIVSEPLFTTALRVNSVRFLADVYGTIAPRYVLSAWFTTRAFAAKNPDVVKRFLAAILETSRWANRHRTESGAIIVKSSKVDPVIVAAMVRSAYAEQFRDSEFKSAIDAAVAAGVITRPITMAELLYRA